MKLSGPWNEVELRSSSRATNFPVGKVSPSVVTGHLIYVGECFGRLREGSPKILFEKYSLQQRGRFTGCVYAGKTPQVAGTAAAA